MQVPTAQERADAEAAALRGQINPFLDDLRAVADELRRRGVDVRATHSGENLPSLRGLRPDEIFAFGGLMTMWRWLQRFHWESRLSPSYPAALEGCLNRRNWRGTLDQLSAGPASEIRPIFVKPCRPCFPDGGRLDAAVWRDLAKVRDMARDVHPTLAQEQFMCSEVVAWVSEYRCYVMRGRLLGIHAYQLLGRFCGPVDASELEDHVPDLRPSVAFVMSAIEKLEASGEAPDAYALDFGLIAHGRVSLVELNDAVALTNYGLPIGDHLDAHIARWLQLARSGTA